MDLHHRLSQPDDRSAIWLTTKQEGIVSAVIGVVAGIILVDFPDRGMLHCDLSTVSGTNHNSYSTRALLQERLFDTR